MAVFRRSRVLSLLVGSIFMGLIFLVGSGSSAGTFAPKAAEIKVMAYNVENLFDTEHDSGKSDWEFLPANYPGKRQGCSRVSQNYREACLKTDWTPARLQLKLQQIRTSVLSNGSLPDVLALVEVENRNVVGQLAKVMGYESFVLEEGGDPRGIDVAVLYREDKLIYLGHDTRKVSAEDQGSTTRDILGVYFQFKNDPQKQVLAVYANHWPSQASPAIKRYQVAEQLKAFMEQDRAKYGAAYHALAVGDFNTIDEDWPHPHRGVLLNREWENYLLDALGFKKRDDNFPLGSYFYMFRMDWNYLDHIFLTQSLRDGKGLEVQPNSFAIGRTEMNSHTFEYRNPSFQQFGSRITGVPRPYNHNADTPEAAGVSDHFPVSIIVRLN